LFGHSDGASITQLYAARYPQQVAAAIVLTPDVLAEDNQHPQHRTGAQGLSPDRSETKAGALSRRPDSAFWGWNDICLHDAFREWSIEDEIETIRCPVLVVQGADDEYGTLRQFRGIADRVPQTEVVDLADCGHSPHRDQPDRLIDCVSHFMQANRLDRTMLQAGDICR
jgi:pimeloyl-ACP methyl ester carboxylesterase